MVTTIETIGPVGGVVHVYKKLTGDTTWTDLGKTILPISQFDIPVGYVFRFYAEPQLWQTFLKYTDASGGNVITNPKFEGTITTDGGTLKAYFNPNYINIGIGIVILIIILYSMGVIGRRRLR